MIIMLINKFIKKLKFETTQYVKLDLQVTSEKYPDSNKKPYIKTILNWGKNNCRDTLM